MKIGNYSDQEYSQQILAIPRLGGPSWGRITPGETPPKGLPLWVCPLGQEEQAAAPDTQWVGTPPWGGNTAWEKAREGGLSPPVAPPIIYL